MPPRRRKKTAAAVQLQLPVPFRLPVWPERTCREPVAGEFASHSCEVVEAHLGPHASQSVKSSVERRQQWEAEHPEELEPTSAADPYA